MIEYGWRSTDGIAYVGDLASVRRWAAGKSSGIVAIVPLEEWEEVLVNGWITAEES
jgi:hypothetical protein